MFMEQQLEDFGQRNKLYQLLKNSVEFLDMKKNIDGEQSVTKDLQMTHVAKYAVLLKQDHNALPGLNLKSSKIMKYTILMTQILTIFLFSFQI